jgi:hypothetical protein
MTHTLADLARRLFYMADSKLPPTEWMRQFCGSYFRELECEQYRGPYEQCGTPFGFASRSFSALTKTRLKNHHEEKTGT